MRCPLRTAAHRLVFPRKPNLTRNTTAAGLFAAAAHGGSVLAMGAGAVSFAQIVKACEPVYVALLCLVVPPIEVAPSPLPLPACPRMCRAGTWKLAWCLGRRRPAMDRFAILRPTCAGSSTQMRLVLELAAETNAL